MLITFGLVIPILIAVLVLFFGLSPKTASRRNVIMFNAASILFAVIISGGYALYLRGVMEGTSDYAWWPVLSLLASMIISSTILVVLGLVRNLVIFKKRDA